MTSPTQFCGSCGQPMTYGSLFCTNCGTSHSSTRGVEKVGSPAPPAALAAPPLAPAAESATLAARVGAYLLDGVAAALIGLAAALPLLFTSAWYTTVGVEILGLVLFVVLEARGTSIGKSIVGIRVVRLDSGARPGVGLGTGRFVLRQLMIGFTMSVGGFSPLWDSSGRRRAWWDKVCGTVVVPAGPALAFSRPLGADDPQEAADPLGGPPWSRPTDSVEPLPKTPSVTSPSAQWSDRPSSRAVSEGVRFDSGVGDLGSTSPFQVEEAVPWADAQADSVIISSVPGSNSSDPAVGLTMLRPGAIQRSEVPANWMLALDNGRTIELTGPLVIGRDPALEVGESPATLLAVPDETRSISKTHLRVEPVGESLRVTDRFSTNGVAVVINGVATACLPGVPTSVPAHSVIRFGDRELRVTTPPLSRR